MRFSNISWQLSSLSIASLIAFPLLALLWISFDASQGIWRHLADTVLLDYVLTSVWLMLGVAVSTFALGVGAAYLVTHYEFTGKGIFTWALLLPLAVPTYITAYSYTGLLDVAGPLQSQLRTTFNVSYGQYWFPEIRSLGGAIFVMSFVLYPYVYLLARAAFVEQSSSFRNAAQLLGLSQHQAFFKVTLPIARPAIVAGISLALMETLADYGAVSYFGLSTFTTGIFRTWYGLDSVAGAAQLALILLGFVIVLMTIEKQSRKRARYQSSKTHSPFEPEKLSKGKNALVFSFALIPLLFGFIVPMSQLVIWALSTYDTLFTAEFWQLVSNTLTLASLTAIIALILALVVAYAYRLTATTTTQLSKTVVGLGYAVPGTVIAVGTLVPLAFLDNTIDDWFRTHVGISTGLILSGTLTALVIAYLVRFLAVALSSVESGLSTISPNIDQAARSLGRTPANTVRTIHMPMLRSSLLTALIIVFVDVMKELPATLILRPFNFNTLAVRAYELASDERLMDASFASIFIVLAGLIPVIFLTKASLKQTH